MNQSVAKLVRFGYQREEVAGMSLPLFVASLDAVEQIQAHERSAFILDMASVVSGALGSKGKNPVKAQLEELAQVARGT